MVNSESVNNKWLLCVRCYTYNHSRYIADALNGFVMQQTDFPFVCAIIDDASTDGEQIVLREYLNVNFDLQDKAVSYEKDNDYGHVTFARHKTNKNCFFAVTYLNENHYSQRIPKIQYLAEWMDAKYIALCEGDDYWTDPKKLQKQVDFLESHPDFSLCCHRFKRYYENTDTWGDDYVTEPFAKHPNEDGLVVTNIENFRTRFTWTLTLCYRKAVADEIVWHPYILGRRDFTFHYHLLKAGKGYCFADYMGVYRINSGGVWQRMSSFDKVRFRLNGYDDFYSYHKDDEDVLICYLEWLDRFYHDYAFSVFARHKITKNGVKSTFFAAKHYWKLKGPVCAIKKCCLCAMAYLAPKKCEKWKQ